MTTTEPVKCCALPGCENLAPAQAAGARRQRNYCSNACRQKAYRDRHHLLKRNTKTVTFWEQAADAIDHLTQAQLHSLKQRIDAKLDLCTTTATVERPPLALPAPTCVSQACQLVQPQSAATDLFYLRKGKGIIHLAVNHCVAGLGLCPCAVRSKTFGCVRLSLQSPSDPGPSVPLRLVRSLFHSFICVTLDAFYPM